MTIKESEKWIRPWNEIGVERVVHKNCQQYVATSTNLVIHVNTFVFVKIKWRRTSVV